MYIIECMAARERTRRPPRAQTRSELLDAAAQVFARRGFDGASVEAVAEQAGFSTGAVYSNFAGKQELFLSLYEERIQRRRRELSDAVTRAGGRGAGLASAAAEVEKTFEAERDWFLLYFEFVLHAARNPSFARRFQLVREEGLSQLAEGLTAGLEHAGVESSITARELAEVIRALTYGLALDRLVESERGSDRSLGSVLELLFRGLRSEAQAR
jgi:AcrR family transcriptional regulator